MLTSVFGPPTNLTAQFGGQQLEIDCQPSLRPTKKLRQVPSGGKASLINHGSRSSSTSRRSSRASSSKSVSKAPSATSYTAQEISDYESRIAFIQRQHEKMLFALHTEVEDLKRKNKDLQFQLVMSSSPMDNSGAVETFESQPAVVATQVLPPEEAIKLEELEAVMKQLQADLHEARSRNIYLTGLIEDQKRKLEDYELKETAERVVKKATTSFPLSPPGGSSISMVSSSSSTKVNTPIPKRSRSEDRIKLQEIEIERLQVDNIRQRQELLELRLFLERNVKMKFRGCNHPARLLHRPQRQNSNPDYLRDRLGSSMTSLDRVDLIRDSSRSHSLSQLPTITKQKNGNPPPSRQSFHDGLPPVPGSSGSESSMTSNSVSRKTRAPPLNLVSLREENEPERRSSSRRRLKLKNAVMMPSQLFKKRDAARMEMHSSQDKSE